MEKRVRLAVASGVHFLMDFACAFALCRTLSGAPERAAALLIYNFCAFALQMPLGLLADRINRNFQIAGWGCCVAALGFFPLPVTGMAVLLGVGNALFHVGGGLEVLTDSPKRCGPLGVFVSPGAAGLYIGGVLGRIGLVSGELPALLLVSGGICLFLTQRTFRAGGRSENPPVSFSEDWRRLLMPLAGFFIVVALRSLVGMNTSFPWKTPGRWSLLAVCALALGKAAGGFLADRFGLVRTAGGTLAVSAGFYLLSGNPLCGLAAVFLFNMSMPLTLFGAARLLPGAKGFAFGTLTFALFLGFLPVYYDAPALSGAWAAVIAVLSAAALTAGLRMVPERSVRL